MTGLLFHNFYSLVKTSHLEYSGCYLEVEINREQFEKLESIKNKVGNTVKWSDELGIYHVMVQSVEALDDARFVSGAWWYDQEPKWIDGEWSGYSFAKNGRSSTEKATLFNYQGDWKDSLRKRP